MKKADSPLISVTMGVRCRRGSLALLERSISSILNQTFQTFEFLICDDGSSCAAKSMLEDFAATDSRIRLIRPGNKLSLPEKLNACLREAEGRLIARMDDDDVSEPKRFERQMAYLRAHPEVAFVGSNVQIFCDGQALGVRHLPEFPTVQDFLFVQPFIHPALLFRREALEAVKGYCEASFCIGCEDYDLLLRLYGLGYRGANMQEILFCYSVPGAGTSNRTFSMRINEVKTRWLRFRELELLPAAIPYVIKPIAVGLLPPALMRRLKSRYYLEGSSRYEPT